MKTKLWITFATASLLLSSVSACSGDVDETPPTLVELYFVADTPQGFRLFSEIREFDEAEGELLESVMGDLVSGDLQPLDPDYVNLWDSSHRLNSLSLSGTHATLDLDLGALNVGAEAEARAIDQLVWTLTGISPEIQSVTILVDGEAVESLAGHVDATIPFVRSQGIDVLSPIQISTPLEVQVLANPVVIEGQACTFEANVVWELVRGDVVLQSGFTTAESACPERSSWSVALDDLAPGTYLFNAWEESAEEGSRMASDSRHFVVS